MNVMKHATYYVKPSLTLFMPKLRKATDDFSIKTFCCKYTICVENDCLFILKHVL